MYAIQIHVSSSSISETLAVRPRRRPARRRRHSTVAQLVRAKRALTQQTGRTKAEASEILRSIHTIPALPCVYVVFISAGSLGGQAPARTLLTLTTPSSSGQPQSQAPCASLSK
jgi:hypothetical protein